MFTGIIEAIGKVERLEQKGSNRDYLISSRISAELRVDESVNHDGVCLTVTKLEPGGYWVTAIRETLDRSTLGSLKPGSEVNLERSMPINGRFDGHIVQGHVDAMAVVTDVHDERGSWRFTFRHDPSPAALTVEKGSVCVNGVSLTCFSCSDTSFEVAIIPHTFEKTGFHALRPGDRVNIEFDILGKYIKRVLSGHAG
jgi:riboflavin synthase